MQDDAENFRKSTTTINHKHDNDRFHDLKHCNVSKIIQVDHESGSYIVFNFIVTFFNLFSTLFYIYCAAFRVEIFYDGKHYDSSSYQMFVVSIIFETFFAMNILINFVLTYTDEKHQRKVTKPYKIYKNYLEGNFILDFIPFIPLNLIQLKNDRHTLFYLIKIIRLYNCFKLFNVGVMIQTIRLFV